MTLPHLISPEFAPEDLQREEANKSRGHSGHDHLNGNKKSWQHRVHLEKKKRPFATFPRIKINPSSLAGQPNPPNPTPQK